MGLSIAFGANGTYGTLSDLSLRMAMNDVLMFLIGSLAESMIIFAGILIVSLIGNRWLVGIAATFFALVAVGLLMDGPSPIVVDWIVWGSIAYFLGRAIRKRIRSRTAASS